MHQTRCKNIFKVFDSVFKSEKGSVSAILFLVQEHFSNQGRIADNLEEGKIVQFALISDFEQLLNLSSFPSNGSELVLYRQQYSLELLYLSSGWKAYQWFFFCTYTFCFLFSIVQVALTLKNYGFKASIRVWIFIGACYTGLGLFFFLSTENKTTQTQTQQIHGQQGVSFLELGHTFPPARLISTSTTFCFGLAFLQVTGLIVFCFVPGNFSFSLLQNKIK